MPFTLDRLVGDPDLQLQVAYAGHGDDPVVTGAHVSELIRPSGWLAGGEVLMTIGLVLPMTADDCRAYVQDVKDGGAVAVALGLGSDLPHQTVPAPLVEAARAVDLPLLGVPEDVPFIALTRAVFAALAAEDRQALERSVALHRALTTSAASGRGLDAIVETWTSMTDVGALITDPLGRRIAASDAGPQAYPSDETVGELVGGLVPRGLRAALRTVLDDVAVEVQPLGTRHLRGFAILVGEPTTRIPVATTALTSLVGLELERRWLSAEPERYARARLLDRVLEAESDQDAEALLRGAGLTDSTFRWVTLDPGDADGADLVADLSLVVRGGLIRHTAGGPVEAVVAGDADIEQGLRRFAPGAAAGVGSAVPPGALAASRAQASAALASSRSAGHPVTYRHGLAYDWLTHAVDPRSSTAFADAVLSPVTAADPHGALVATLHVWLEENCQVEATAARLHLHRHTVRARLRRVEQLLDRPLDHLDTRVELWLALTFTP